MIKNREIALWGGGMICRAWLDGGFDEHVNIIIDNNPQRASAIIKGKIIMAPSDVKDFKNYYIIITSNYYDEIRNQLEGYGLHYGEDFISYIDYMSGPMDIFSITQTLKDIVFDGNAERDFVLEVRSKEEYDDIYKGYNACVQFEKALNKLYQRKIGKRIVYPGYCSVCENDEHLTVDYIWSDGTMPLWRETVFCPICKLNSRMRFLVERVCNSVEDEDSVYICEQVTPTFKALQSKIKNLIGSEYLRNDYTSGKVYDGITHQDVQNLSFADEIFNCIASADVYEHVSDYRKAFTEAYRCLKKGGKLIFSIPIFKEKQKSVTRTVIENGMIRNILPAVYHGNPLSTEGSLVFTDFGWDVLTSLRNVGFKDAYALVYFSTSKGYFGDLPIIFEAKK